MNYPEHEKLEALNGKNEVVGDFIEWLQEQGFAVARRHSHTDACGEPSNGFPYVRPCGYTEGEFQRDPRNTERLIADFFSIDVKKLDAEKAAMIRYVGNLRASQAKQEAP